jgi:hypothetical protein
LPGKYINASSGPSDIEPTSSAFSHHGVALAEDFEQQLGAGR